MTRNVEGPNTTTTTTPPTIVHPGACLGSQSSPHLTCVNTLGNGWERMESDGENVPVAHVTDLL